MRCFFLIGLSLLLLLGGCYTKPVRHLASDASLIRTGESTRQEVLRYLGEPDGRRMVAPGIEEFVYAEDRRSLLQRTPLVRSVVDAEVHEILIITLAGDLVSKAEFRTHRKQDRKWMDDFSWDELR
jgi:hypothetical protein